jgi:uncharacterized membrane protein
VQVKHPVWGRNSPTFHFHATLPGMLGAPLIGDVLVARVRSKLGRAVSHPSAIEVTAHQGCVTLCGPILAHEVPRLLRTVRAVHGVCEIENQLEVHEQADGIAALQGSTSRPGEVPEILQANWTPALRLLVGTAGGAVRLSGLTRGGVLGMTASLAGAGMLARAVTNIELPRLIGAGSDRWAMDIQKTIKIQAPIEEVYNFWANVEHFPHFMTPIEVRHLGEGRSHWVAEGPASTSVTWDAEITVYEPNRRLAWQSTPGSMIENAGLIHFDANPDGSTRVHLRWSYHPPAGAVGHAVAWLLGKDLKTELDEDLVRLKSRFEHGKTRAASGEVVQRDALAPSPAEGTPTQ